MLTFISSLGPWAWLALAVVFAVIEACTISITTIWFAVGAILMAFISFAKIPFGAQLLIFLIISIVLMLLFRKAVLEFISKHKEKTNVDSLIGKTAIVVKKITKFEKGEVKISGNVWTAKTEDDSELAENSECTINRIEGVTAIVSALQK